MNIPYPGILRGKDRQNAEVPIAGTFQRAIYFRAIASGPKNIIIGTVPRNCIISQPTFIHITESFNGNNIWLKVGTALNISSVGKVLSHNAGIFYLQNTAFSTVPNDYGVVFNQDKILTLSIASETPSTSATRGSMFGILYYTDLTQVEGF